ncbi:MAG: MBL fold metallo-hydrolase [Deltaproteobacteria bacterium]|jgi:metallo-beta-lactamase family protein|nr:MBL fold metallo-hydrolase [Deltaproteobacteria bacterium]
MKIRCLGAARTVTGSCHQLENPKGGFTLIDCGLFQGGRQTELRNFNTAVYRPDLVKAIVLTHAHMDHSGLVPRLVQAGYRGPVFATEATADLLGVLWQDAAYIQEQEAQWKTRKNKRQGGKKVDPLYDRSAAAKAAELLRPLPLNQDTEIVPGVTVKCLIAGHILGAATLRLVVSEPTGPKSVVFSGDIGRQGQLLIDDPVIPEKSDVVFMETTYGNRRHKDLDTSKTELTDIVNQACRDGGKILIPAFAVERTQELMVLLAQMWHENLIPQDMPIILDSPLAISASEIYLAHPELYDQETKELLAKGHDPMSVKTLRIARTSEESQKLNEIQGPALIMAGSGMANAGRILHHLKHNLWRPNCHVVFVGFQAQGTTGRRLVEGAQTVKIFREAVSVNAKIHTVGGFSGHADQAELVEWLKPQMHPSLTVVLIHGEETGTLAFQQKLKEISPDLSTIIPNWLQTLDLPAAGTLPLSDPFMPAPEEVDEIESPLEKTSFKNRLERLKTEFRNRPIPLSPEKLSALEDLLLKAEEIVLGP